MKNKLLPFAVLLIITPFTACKKKQDTCGLIQQVKITGARALYHVGDTIQLGTSVTPYALYRWVSSSQPNEISGGPTVFIYPCSKYDEGWYTVEVSNSDCASHIDSVYIKVVNDPENAPCSPTVNSVSFSSLPDITFSTNWGLDPSWSCKDLSANPPYGYPDFNIYFNPYWNNQEPEDGPYSISPDFNWENGPYTVHIASTYEGLYFEANSDTVYITHNNGKLQATFCNLNFSAVDASMPFTTTAKGNLTAP